MIRKIAVVFSLLFVPSMGRAIDQGYTHFKSSITVDGLTHGTTIQATKSFKLPDGTIMTSTSQFAGALTLGTTNGLSLSGTTLSLGTASANTTGALKSTDWTTFNSKISTVSLSATSPIQYGSGVISIDKSSATLLGPSPTTSVVSEGSNLYYTTVRATTAISATTPISNTNGVIAIDKSSVTLLGPSPTTSVINEGSNLYFTTARSTSSISSTTPITYDNGVIGIDESALLSTTTAANTYLTKSSATATYLQNNSSSTFLTTSSATATYIQNSSVTATYLQSVAAASTYLTQSSATITYLQDSSATATYFPIVSSTTLLTTSSATATYITKSSATATYLNNTNTISNALIDTSSITKQGNTFNGTSALVQTTSGGLLPALSAANLTSLPAGNLTGTVPNSTLDPSSVTKYGSSIPAASIASGSLGSSVIASSIAASGASAGTYGSSTQVGTFTVAGDGRISGASNITISLTNTNLQSGTYTNVTVPATNVAAGSLGGSVIASSIAVSGVTAATYGSAIQSGVVVVAGDGRITSASNSTITPAAASITAGSLGSSVIASSHAVNSVQDSAIVAVSASKLTGTGTLPNTVLDSSSVTLQGQSVLTNSSATATYLQLSSATATYLQNSSATATYLSLSSATATYLPVVTPSTLIVSTASTAAVSLVNNTYVNYISMSVPAGTWAICGQLKEKANGALGVSDFEIAISSFSGNTTTDAVTGDNVLFRLANYGTTDQESFTIANWIATLSASTTIYLKGLGGFTSGTAQMAGGRMNAVKIK